MFIVSRRNIRLPSADGSRVYPVSRGFIGEVPDWAADTDYFRALVADGKIGIPETHKDTDVETAAKRRKAKGD